MQHCDADILFLVLVFHLRVSYFVSDSKGCPQADVLIYAAASLRFTHPSYRSQT